MEIRHLITFKAIVDHGGYTRAAEQLGYAQSTVTSHIKTIEQELNTCLFNRIGRNMMLTEAGQHLMPYAEEMIRIFEKAKQIPLNEGEIRGSLTIGAPESLTVYRLPLILREYRKKYPQVKITLKSSTFWGVREELRQGKTDIAFFLESVQEEEDLHIEKLITEPMALILPFEHSLKNKKFNDLKFSEEETFLYTENGCSYRTFFEEYLRNQGISPKNTLEFWSVEAIKQCVMCGLGISLLPLITVESELRENKLSGILYDEKRVATQLVYQKNKWFSPALTKFLEMVQDFTNKWDDMTLLQKTLNDNIIVPQSGTLV